MTQLRHVPEHLGREALNLWFRRSKPEDEGPPEYLIRCTLEVVDRWFDHVLLNPHEFPRPAIPDEVRKAALAAASGWKVEPHTDEAWAGALGDRTPDEARVDAALEVVDEWIATQWVTWFERYEGLEQRKNVRMEECLRALANPRYTFNETERAAMISRALSDVDEQGFPA